MGKPMPSGSASRVRTDAQELEAEPLELWAETLYSYSLNGKRASEASVKLRSSLVQMKTSSSS